MKLTVVITTYNQEQYISEAIEGVLMQKTNFPFKVVVSNDCSTDDTLIILKKYNERYPEKIEIINNEKNLGGMGNFINTLNQIKDTEYVALCDGDDFWTDENKLQKQIDFLDNNKEFNICFHKARLFYQNKKNEDEIIPQGAKEISTINDLVESNYIVANSVVYRWKFNKEDLKEIFPNNIVPGDYYLHLLHAQDGKIKMFNEVMSAYRRHENGMWWSNDSSNKERFTLEYGEKFLNFYNSADKYIKLPENSFLAQRTDIIYNLIVTYISNDMFNDLNKIFALKKDKDIAIKCLKDIINRNIWYLDYLRNREEAEKKIKEEKDELIQLRSEIKKIKNSRWWKIRNFIKMGKK